MEDLPPDVQRYLDEVVRTLHDHLAEALIGVYLHGSLAMGAFTPGRSDVDVLAICGAPPGPERATALGNALAGIPRPPSGGHLELKLVTDEEVRSPSAGPSYELAVSTHEEPMVVLGSEDPGTEYLEIDFAMTRARGRALMGPGPDQVIGGSVPSLLLRALLKDMEWAREGGSAAWEGHESPALSMVTYRVLNAARNWRFAETGELGSKAEGAAWVQREHPEPRLSALLDTALAFQRGGSPDLPDDRLVNVFTERVEAMLRAAIR
jgi:hypothetical protein